MKKLQLVEPFKYTYRVLDRMTMAFRGNYNNLQEIFEDYPYYKENFSDGYGDKILYRTILGKMYLTHPDKAESHGKHAIIRIEDGYILNHTDIVEEGKTFNSKKYRKRYDEKYDRAKDLIKTKNNCKKIKNDWSARIRPARHGRDGYFYEEYYYSCRNMGYHRLGDMVNEQCQLEGIVDEYEQEYPNIVRARRKGLPFGWSGEKGISAYGSAKSWKHHSKRRKQWIPQ